MFKRCKVVLLPTKEKASMFIDTIEPNILIFDSNYVSSNVHYKDVPHQNLYIISDDDIKEGDWITDDNRIAQVNCLTINDPNRHLHNKIIATTDTSLTVKGESAGDNNWYNPLPQPSQQFIIKYIEEYNKGNIITDVMIEYEQVFEDKLEGREFILRPLGYKLKVNPKDNTITIKKIKDSWNREEVIELLKKSKQDFLYHRGIQILDGMLDNWIKENL
jgi:hypothetical protein